MHILFVVIAITNVDGVWIIFQQKLVVYRLYLNKCMWCIEYTSINMWDLDYIQQMPKAYGLYQYILSIYVFIIRRKAPTCENLKYILTKSNLAIEWDSLYVYLASIEFMYSYGMAIGPAKDLSPITIYRVKASSILVSRLWPITHHYWPPPDHIMPPSCLTDVIKLLSFHEAKKINML